MKNERIDSLEQYILTKGNVTLDELCSVFEMSKNTIRRDIEEIVRRGSVKKVYGGAVVNTDNDIPIKARSGQYANEKYRIGQLASEYVCDGDIIFIDSGTTTVQIIPFIARKQKITVLTCSLPVIVESENYNNINLISLGGIFNHSTSTFLGSMALNSLKNINVSKAFIAATGVSIDGGLMNNTFFEAETKKEIVSMDTEIILMADSSKIGRKALITVCPLDRINVFVTSECPPKEYVEYFNDHKIEVVY